MNTYRKTLYYLKISVLEIKEHVEQSKGVESVDMEDGHFPVYQTAGLTKKVGSEPRSEADVSQSLQEVE